jgi:hypothetical protein
MQELPPAKPPVGVVFDSDMGASIDAALALALLYGFDGKNEARVISVSTSKSSLNSAAYCDVLARFYSSAPKTGPFAGFSRMLPVGMAGDGKSAEDMPMLTAPLAKRSADGTPAYSTTIHKLNDTAIVPALIRNALTAQYDENALVVLAGPATNLVSTLELEGARAWIQSKVRFLSVALGSYPNGDVDAHVKADIAAARKLFAEWPTPIVAAGGELRDAVLFPASSIEKDFGWTPNHPIVDAYRAYKPMPYDAPTRDMASVLYAVRPQEGYFKLSEPGTISVLDSGNTKFTPSADGKHRYLIFDPAQKDRILKIYTELASAKPVVRQPRFPKKQDEEKDKDKPQAPTKAADKPEAKPPVE